MAFSDPCVDHPCDRCWICTQLGICCGQVPHLKAATAEHTHAEELKRAVQLDSPNLRLADLVQLDIAVRMLDKADNHFCGWLSLNAPTQRALSAGPSDSVLLNSIRADALVHQYHER